jgi:hypothetical protein
MKKGAPKAEVIAPTGISLENPLNQFKRFLATRSHRTRRQTPVFIQKER